MGEVLAVEVRVRLEEVLKVEPEKNSRESMTGAALLLMWVTEEPEPVALPVERKPMWTLPPVMLRVRTAWEATDPPVMVPTLTVPPSRRTSRVAPAWLEESSVIWVAEREP